MAKKIAVSGASGLVASAIIPQLVAEGYQVVRITRDPSQFKYEEETCQWDVNANTIEREKLDRLEAVVHLAGATISKRWSKSYKEKIYKSRIQGTRFLCETLAKLDRKPAVFLCASAVGYYGTHSPEHVVDESSPAGNDFLARVCREWEEATRPAEEAGIRVVNMRFGVVLSDQGGALKQMLPVFKAGLGGRLGSGRQMISWIALEEIPYVVVHILNNPQISGPINVTSPFPVSNADFTKALAGILDKPVGPPVPSIAIKLLLGEMGETLLLKGARVQPARLSEFGYDFIYPQIDEALSAALSMTFNKNR